MVAMICSIIMNCERVFMPAFKKSSRRSVVHVGSKYDIALAVRICH